MPPSRFNRTAWPEAGAHREMLEFLDAVHRRFGTRSLREVGRSMHLSYSRVHDIVRGISLPVSEDQVRSLVFALVGSHDAEAELVAAQAAELFVKARRARDEEGVSMVLPQPPTAPAADADPGVTAVAEGNGAPEVVTTDAATSNVTTDAATSNVATPDGPTSNGAAPDAVTSDDASPTAGPPDVAAPDIDTSDVADPAAETDDAGAVGSPVGRGRVVAHRGLLADAPTNDEVVPGPGAGRPRRRWGVAALAAVVVVAVTVVATYLLVPSSPERRTGSVVLQDSFSGTELDPQRWLPPTRADLIYPLGGALHFVVGPTDSADGAESRLEPRSMDGFRQISFVVATARATKQGPGGAGLTLRLADGKKHRLVWGPGEQGSLVAALVCSRAVCNNYDDFDPPGSYVLTRPGNGSTDRGEEVPVRIVQVVDGTVQFFVRGQLVAQGPPGDAPLQTFSWDLYGAKSEAWDLTVNSLIVTD
ncbi:hypothetical protein EV383_4801 [Pseudonocardia sediminis]|uniref:Uncharacterized protein n=1 Tax=Pseudonocardia sediminis TaxID=1397368 RepID=A0A4Q7V5D8_PSEST|nr:hypothetical protein [Pseudonocardia sediminis]RZT87869.1 hypothetical protein EV383_4801 [Pseudonocardia sediminis]